MALVPMVVEKTSEGERASIVVCLKKELLWLKE